jgi:hypothetical protein
LKNFTDHLSSITKSVVIDEENSFSTISSDHIQLTKQHQALFGSYLPSDLMQRVDSIKMDFNG